MDITINKSEDSKTLHVSVVGSIDTSTAGTFEERILPAMADCTAVEIDMAEVSYISSAGLRILLKLVQLCPNTTIKNPNSVVKDVLDMTGMNTILTIV